MGTIEIAGVCVAVDAEQPWLQRGFDDVIGAPPTAEPATARIGLRRGVGSVPDRAPDDEHRGIRLWLRTAGPILTFRDVVIEVNGSVADVMVPRQSSLAALDVLIGLALCWLLAEQGRYVLHAGAVGIDGEAVLLVGRSGSGKSTAVFAALEAGWRALSDDLVALEVAESRVLVHGIHQAPVAPLEIGGRLVAGAEPLTDRRNRGRISSSVLATGPSRVVGTVAVGHGAGPDGTLERVPGHRLTSLLMQSFATSSDRRHQPRFLRVAAQLCRLPSWELGHSSDPSRRRDVALTHLRRCLTEGFSDVGP